MRAKVIDTRPVVTLPTQKVNEIPKYTYFTGELQGYRGLFYKSYYSLDFLGATSVRGFDNELPTSWNETANRTNMIINYQPVDVEVRIL